MIGETGNGKEPEDIDDEIGVSEESDDALLTETIVEGDNVGDISVEINVEELVADLEATESDDVERKREIKRRLEELSDEREAEKELDSTYNFNIDEDL